jgi:hypothetical protein
MDRLTVTKAATLQMGDRFYKAADKSKTVLIKVAGETYQKKTNAHFCKKDGERFPQAINRDTMVVFLRHSNNQ